MSNTNIKSVASSQKEAQGVSVLFVVFIMTIVLAIALGVSGIVFKQTKMLGEAGQSVAAFSAADSGIEQHLFILYKLPPPQPLFTGECGGATFQVLTKCGLKNAADCPAGLEIDYSRDVYFWTKSVGTYRNVKRAIEIEY